MESVLNYMTVSNVLDLQERGCLNKTDYYYYVESGVIKYEESNRFMERQAQCLLYQTYARTLMYNM